MFKFNTLVFCAFKSNEETSHFIESLLAQCVSLNRYCEKRSESLTLFLCSFIGLRCMIANPDVFEALELSSYVGLRGSDNTT